MVESNVVRSNMREDLDSSAFKNLGPITTAHSYIERRL